MPIVSSRAMPDSPAPRPSSAAMSVQDDLDHDTPPKPPSAYAQKAGKRKTTFGIKQHMYNPASSAYDYEQKYPPDAPYHEIDEDARVWHVYNDEAEILDRDMIEEAGDTLDILLIFAALFSGVVTTLVIETASKLDTDYTEVTVNLLQEMVALQRAGDNATARTAIPAAELSTSPTNADVWVNGLWFTSLALSLSTALLAVLAKQWLRHYSSVVTGSARDRAFIRQFRWEGFDGWHVQAIIGILPTILHASLGLFLAGLVVFLYPLDIIIARVVLALSAILGVVYAATTFLPIIFVKCSYRTQLSSLLAWITWQVLYIGATFSYFVAKRCYSLYTKRHPLGNHHRDYYWNESVKKIAARSRNNAKEVERSTAVSAMQAVPVRAPELLVWLIRNTASSSAKRIAAQSLGPCNFDYVSILDRSTLLTPCVSWTDAMIKTVSNRDMSPDLADWEMHRRWMCSVASFDPMWRWNSRFLTGLEFIFPSLELAILILDFVGGRDSLEWWPGRIIVKSPTEEYSFLDEDKDNRTEDFVITNIWKTVLEHYDPADPPCFPLLIWSRLQQRRCLPNIEDVETALWKTLVYEVLANKREYAEELKSPDNYQSPISLARYYVPMFFKKGWLRRYNGPPDYEWEMAPGNRYGELEGHASGTFRASSRQASQIEIEETPRLDGYERTEAHPMVLMGGSKDARVASESQPAVDEHSREQEGQSSQVAGQAQHDEERASHGSEDTSEREELGGDSSEAGEGGVDQNR